MDGLTFNVQTREDTQDFLMTLLNNKIGFAFSRWGDGEWDCMLHPNSKKCNCDGVAYTSDLSTALNVAMQANRSEVMYAVQTKAAQMYGKEISQYADIFPRSWYYADVFHDMSLENRMLPFREATTGRDMILVGPQYMEKIATKFIPVREQDAWGQHWEITGELLKRIKQDSIVMLCAGMLSKVLINDLAPLVVSRNATLIDMGSVLDVYCGKVTRKYHKKIMGEK